MSTQSKTSLVLCLTARLSGPVHFGSMLDQAHAARLTARADVSFRDTLWQETANITRHFSASRRRHQNCRRTGHLRGTATASSVISTIRFGGETPAEDLSEKKSQCQDFYTFSWSDVPTRRSDSGERSRKHIAADWPRKNSNMKDGRVLGQSRVYHRYAYM